MSIRDELRPVGKPRVIDMLAEAGHDVSVWSEGLANPAFASINPKYALEWSFLEEGRPVVFKVWYDDLVVESGAIRLRDNMRARMAKLPAVAGTAKRRASFKKFDHRLQLVWNESLPVRLIFMVGLRRTSDDVASPKSEVTACRLDDATWALTRYDDATGAYELTRGAVVEKPGNQAGGLAAPDDNSPHIDPYGVDPVSWSPHHWGRRVPAWRNVPTHGSSASS